MKSSRSSESEEVGIEMPLQFTQQAQPQEVWEGDGKETEGLWSQEDESVDIDEELLKKLSELHSAKQANQLLHFQLMECKIMKKSHKQHNHSLMEQIEQSKVEKSKLHDHNLIQRMQIQTLEREAACLKEENNKHQQDLRMLRGRVKKSSKQITEMRGRLERAASRSKGYVSVETMRVEGDSQKYEQRVEKLKGEVHHMKREVESIRKGNRQLQEEYERLMGQLARKSKKNQTKSHYQEGYINQQSNYEFEYDKENDMNSVNAVTIDNDSAVSQLNKVVVPLKQDSSEIGQARKRSKTQSTLRKATKII